MNAHPTAIVSRHAELDPTVEIGPYAIIEDEVSLGKNVKVYAHAYICNGTRIDEGTEIHMGAVIGHLPQDLAFEGKKSYLKIGKKNIIREYVTIHRGTKEDSSTQIGDESFLMALSHVGHNCKLGNKVILANGALLAGYVNVADGVFISGNVVVHQFCNIGKLAIIGGFSGVNKDVPPYMAVRGPSSVWSINLVGLRRAGYKSKTISEIKEAFKLIYKSDLNTDQAITKIVEGNPGKEVMDLIEFIKNSKRGICKYRFSPDDKDYFG
ncbi:MAG: acyl-[acyl-carrier-protein]--UDP-N-acetylglucosamine O-acyltransferase [Omnitrophica bacterium RBG_13_46_9]|nr:MAG: acyl-[acyl-carrier-protein]--UDP-N-acetylglucosamine O-acyltransferase [Omnitrophica bacterium RBG_13_46_9]